MNYKAIIINIARALLVSALFMFISLAVSFFEGMDSGFVPLAISFLITTLVGVFPFIFIKNTEQIVTLRGGFVSIVAAWILSFIFGSLPYILWGGEFTLANAWFESVSGFTTTGASILTNIEALPKSMLFWRSSTHFIGGLGVVVFLLLVLPQTSTARFRLKNIEISSLSKDGYKYKSSRTVYVIMMVYLVMNLLCFFLLLIAGMEPFDAVNHAFSICATGGFSTKNTSLGFYDSPWIALIAMLFMIVSSLHLGLVYASVTKASLKPLLKQPVVKYYFSTIVLATIAIFISLRAHNPESHFGRTLLESAFTTVSYITTSGFGIVDNADWPLFACFMLMLAALQCGVAGSTSGGLKADRVLIALKGLHRIVFQIGHPSSVSQVKNGKTALSDGDVQMVFAYICMYLFFIFVSACILLALGVGGVEAISGAICSLGNTGAALGDMSVLGSYAHQPVAAKFLYTVNMFLGRLEIYPVLVVLRMMISRR